MFPGLFSCGTKKEEFMAFQVFNFNPQVAAGVAEAGYVTPTPIQTQSIPAVMQGRDVMGLAQTGTGKTAAFALPILHRLMHGGHGAVRALVIAPTRELAEQIHQSIETLGKQTRLRSVTIYGGVGINPQIQKLKKGVEIVVACPGRLLDHIGQGTIDLSRLEVLVLDEADQMFDMGFFPAIRQILKKLPRERQTLLFRPPCPMRSAAWRTMCSAIRSPSRSATRRAGHRRHASTRFPSTQDPLLLELLHHTDTESVLVFTRTKHRAKRLGEQLAKAGYKATSLQGNLSQNKRQAALDGFRDGSFQILVATDIAARGIDVSQVSHVINYDIPDTPEAYVHRIGRTGRAARSGDAFTLVTGEDTAMVRTIEKVLGSTLERRKVDGFDYAVPAPKKDSEFARPPRQPAPRRKPTEAKSAGPACPSNSRPGTPKEKIPASSRPGGSHANHAGNPTANRNKRSRRPGRASSGVGADR
jgi:ATP-dependent RNA helicase RhlE